MKTIWRRRFRFAAQSLLWSLLLYVTTVLLMDWDDLRRRMQNEPYVVSVSPSNQGDKRIGTSAQHIIKAIWLHLTRSHS
ncbi:hypothetical protein CAP35_05950 [Chitinophagaceae bacterium IBVUCB1]|nr:hypothetical protein CAP35_05950 [Chitinophagaceae bacterium IBVUCB1]